MRLRSVVLGVGMRRRFARRLRQLNLRPEPLVPQPVRDVDIAHLPPPAQRYLRYMDVLGRPRDWSFSAQFIGEFRMRRGQRFMPCEAWQYNAVRPLARFYYLRIDVAGAVPMFGTDTYLSGHGRMHGKVLGLVTVADGSGPEFDLSELTTWVNDALSLAPSMLLARHVSWSPVDDASFDIAVSDGDLSSRSRVVVDAEGRLVSICSRDRWAALPSGLTRAPWTTVAEGWADTSGRPALNSASAIWHLPDGDFEYARGRFVPETVRFNIPPEAAAAGRPVPTSSR